MITPAPFVADPITALSSSAFVWRCHECGTGSQSERGWPYTSRGRANAALRHHQRVKHGTVETFDPQQARERSLRPSTRVSPALADAQAVLMTIFAEGCPRVGRRCGRCGSVLPRERHDRDCPWPAVEREARRRQV